MNISAANRMAFRAETDNLKTFKAEDLQTETQLDSLGEKEILDPGLDKLGGHYPKGKGFGFLDRQSLLAIHNDVVRNQVLLRYLVGRELERERNKK